MLEFITKKSPVRDIIFILLGTLVMAIAINQIYDPMELVTGGITGLGVMIKHLSARWMENGIPTWLTYAALNVPILIAALKVMGFRFVSKTVFAAASLTVFLTLIPTEPLFEADYLLSAVFGGVLSGVGTGLVFLTMSTTGGTETLGMLLQKRFPYYSVPRLLMIIDGIIVLSGAVAFGLNKALYSVIAVYVVAKVSDGLLEGMKFAKCAFIVSDKYEDIAKEIMYRLDRGVTGLNGEGMYTHAEKKLLFCIVGKKEIVRLLDIVYATDPQAFVTINDVREVWGEGYGAFKG